MEVYTLQKFIQDCRAGIGTSNSPAECVKKTVPVLFKLLNGDRSFLEPKHFQSDPKHYARNAIFFDDSNTMSLFALVWLPGQHTPIHDHGTWGAIGILEGILGESNFIRVDGQGPGANSGIELVSGGEILLSPGSVTSFVPNPDHIHIAGNRSETQRVVSLHLYGHAMAGFNIYDKEKRTRNWVEADYNES